MAKKPTKKKSGKSGSKSASQRRPVSRDMSKAQVGRSARRRAAYQTQDRMDVQDDRYYELEAFEEREPKEFYEPEPVERRRSSSSSRSNRSSAYEDDMLNEFSTGGSDFYVDESRDRDDRDRRDKRKKAPDKPKEKPERKPMSPTKRKLIRILSTTAIITVVLVVGVVLSLTVLFKTQSFEVTGNTRYNETEIIDACGISTGQNIFLAPKRPAEKRIKNKFPYIEDVHVGFQIPDTIKIAVEEADEGYLMKLNDTEYLIVSTKGRILGKTTTPAQYDLPKFIGPTLTSGEIGDYVSYEDTTVVAMIDSITQTFADNGYQGITEIDATNTADISFTYDNRIKVKLGIPEDLSYKIRTAMTIINENLDKNQTVSLQGTLDVSRCNTTKRSYFTEGSIAPTQAPTQDPSAPTEASTENPSEYTGEYTWTAEGYYYDDGSYVYG